MMKAGAMPFRKNRMSARKVASRAAVYVVLALMSILFILPFYWMFATSIKQPGEVYVLPIKWWPSVPDFSTYARLFRDYKFSTYFGNTVWLTAVNMAGYLASCTLVAYGFATQRWRHRDKLFLFVLATMMLPKEVTFYPQFILFKYIGWYGTMNPLWVPAFFGDAFQIFLIRQFFLGIPRDIMEASRIDGCSRFRTLWNIYVPMSKPVLATSAMYIFMYHWNDFFKPLIYITKEYNRTAALALMYLKSTQDTLTLMPVQMAASVVLAIPCVLLYYFVQRFFVGSKVYKGIK